MGGRVVRLGGRGEGDVAAEDDERRLILDLGGAEQGGLEGVEVLGCLTDLLDVPPVGTEASGRIVRQAELGRTVDRDVVVVIDAHEPTEPEVAGQGRSLVRQPLGEIAVAGDAPGAVVDHVAAEARPELSLGDGQPDGVGDALSEGAGGHLDAIGVPSLGVPRRLASPLAEVAQVLLGDVVPREVEHRVEEDRRMAGGQHEAVAVGPVRIGRVVLHHPGPQHVGEGGQRHGGALVTRAGRVGGVHGEPTYDVDGSLLELRRGHPAHPTRAPYRYPPSRDRV